MDGQTLQTLIYAGYARAAAKTGKPYDVYRTASALNPIDLGNKVATVDCFFAAEKRFEVPHKFKEPTRYLYADGSQLQKGDFLVGDYGTFFVGDMEPNLPIQAIWCNESVAISRVTYVNGIATDDQVIAQAFPCFRQLKRVDQKPVLGMYGASTQTTPIGEWFLYIPIDPSIADQSDFVTDQNGRQYSISTIDPTEIGAVLVIRQSDPPGGTA